MSSSAHPVGSSPDSLYAKPAAVQTLISDYAALHAGEEAGRKENYTTLVNQYYDLATDFYEYGWGTSFHFAEQAKGEEYDAAIFRHEAYLATRMGIQPGWRVLDVGCGVGGPQRNIARLTYAHITGLNNNAYQIHRATLHTQRKNLTAYCDYIKADFMHVPLPDASFDGIYAIEATCHAPDPLPCYAEIFRLLKPNGVFGVYEWCTTAGYDPKNPTHSMCKKDIEVGNGLPDIRSTQEVLDALVKAGFVVVDSLDRSMTSEIPWHMPLSASYSLSGFRHTAVGQLCTHIMLWVLETLGLAPKGSVQTHDMLRQGARGLCAGGKLGVFTPMFFVLCRKPAIGEATPTAAAAAAPAAAAIEASP